MKDKIIKSVLIMLALFLLGFVVWRFGDLTSSNKDVNTTNSTEEIILIENNKKLEEIRNREDIKRQQELIVQEVYLIEEKDKVKNEKDEVIKQFDAQIQEIEKRLEDVRAEKITF